MGRGMCARSVFVRQQQRRREETLKKYWLMGNTFTTRFSDLFPTNKNKSPSNSNNDLETLGNVEVTVNPSLDENYMTSIIYHNHQSIESIEFDRYTPLPIPARGEILIKVLAFGINPIDVKCLENNISQTVIPIPKTLGCEFSGRVVSTTTCYTNYFQIGDLVVGMLPMIWTQKGAAAEYITVNENLCAKVPTNVNAIDAAGIPLAGLTVVQALREFLQENSFPGSTTGKRILIQGGSGGIGTFAIQYCKNVLGMYVIATCSERNIPFIRSLGVDEIVDHEHARSELNLFPFFPFST
jgi:NADPH:quinone reductase-like Zn-dependent oxidoreductase